MRKQTVSKAAAIRQNADDRIWPALFSLCFFASAMIIMIRYG